MKSLDSPTRGEVDLKRADERAREISSRVLRAQAERDALLRVAAAAAGASGLEDVLELVAEEARDAIGAASLAVSRWENDADRIRTLINVGELGPGEERYPDDEVYPATEYPLIAEMIHSGRPYFNALDDDSCHPRAAELLKELGKSSDLGVPIVVEGESWGEVWASKAIGDPPFRAEDISFLEAIAGQFATAIARAELFSRVSRLAYEDSLTGLPNRRALDERLKRALRRFESGGPSVSILLCDLDRLKQINDSHGHEGGDQALRDVAETLVAGAADRPGAFVARVSGDEFCVLLEGHRLAHAVSVGAGAIKALAAEQELSLSCGAATASRAAASPSALLRSADAALYAAKRRGGGQVMSANGATAGPSPGRRSLRGAGATVERITAATGAVVIELDGRLAEAPVLDRLEAVANAYTEAADLAGWTVSVARPGEDVLVDLSLGTNRDSGLQGIRVGPGTEEYRISEFPVTEEIVAAAAGTFIVNLSDGATDERERALLVELGFQSVIGVAAAADDGTYLLELYGDRPNEQLGPLAIPLRLMMSAAMPATAPGRPGARSQAALAKGSELSLAVARRLDAADDAETAVEVTAEELQAAFGCLVVDIVRVDGDSLELLAECGETRTPADWRPPRDTGMIGRCLREGEPVLAGDVLREPQFRGNGPGDEVRSELVVPVRVDAENWGVINLEHTTVDFFGLLDVRLVQAVAAQLGGALHAIDLYASLERAYMGTAEALAAALEAKDPLTARHSTSIVEHAVAIGRRLDMDGEQLRVLRYGAAFHDIGKLAIPRSLLNKPGPLTAQERTLVEKHTVIGERILTPIEFLEPVLPLVRHAHERWDGAGYPDGLAGESIPLGARVLFVCDAYDAMVTDRPYRKALSADDARGELRRGAGSQFDATVVEALLAGLDAADA